MKLSVIKFTIRMESHKISLTVLIERVRIFTQCTKLSVVL